VCRHQGHREVGFGHVDQYQHRHVLALVSTKVEDLMQFIERRDSLWCKSINVGINPAANASSRYCGFCLIKKGHSPKRIQFLYHVCGR
jgi:hypothetical protein